MVISADVPEAIIALIDALVGKLDKKECQKKLAECIKKYGTINGANKYNEWVKGIRKFPNRSAAMRQLIVEALDARRTEAPVGQSK